MNVCDDRRPDATMDPWCLVELGDGDEVLFGFAVEHARTGGLSWVRSTAVVWLDETAGRARTASGRRYALGRRTTMADLPTEEARIAFALLVGPHLADPDAGPPVDGDPAAAAAWVAACKVARHLGLDAPPLSDPAAVARFITSNIESYALLRSGRRPS
ncbi:hypothetical protein [Roseicella sp. DB1501]|uniref:hypothetical protein n=1 Tax=Roseicella sp. DB1501 TaxID=2730925 RepID=UPI0014923ABF|nr:hypothetical protein [Roseicella sp. DB1501]NOG73675.1 hypothetical protein [Roseicella sp. DB1501]